MGNGINSCLRFRPAKQILTHQSCHNSLFLQTAVCCSLWLNWKVTLSRRLFIHISLQWTSHGCWWTHWWHTEQRMWSTIKGWEVLASGGRLKSSHLVQLQRIKARSQRAWEKEQPAWPCVHQVRGSCYASLCVSQMYALCIKQLTNEIISLWLTVAHWLWEKFFDNSKNV